MAPLMWTTLYSTFTILMLMSTSKIFFSMIKTNNPAAKSNSPRLAYLSSINWSW
uniref:ATP synthase F0 subunit 8 n=1 Tax=Proisotoma minuta TaxID=301521 RepID=A0A8K1M3R2_9HEXA|nr:ATP synthase F0 subunit 8 [Proisotoma minuta]